MSHNPISRYAAQHATVLMLPPSNHDVQVQLNSVKYQNLKKIIIIIRNIADKYLFTRGFKCKIHNSHNLDVCRIHIFKFYSHLLKKKKKTFLYWG